MVLKWEGKKTKQNKKHNALYWCTKASDCRESQEPPGLPAGQPPRASHIVHRLKAYQSVPCGARLIYYGSLKLTLAVLVA